MGAFQAVVRAAFAVLAGSIVLAPLLWVLFERSYPAPEDGGERPERAPGHGREGS